MTGIDEAGRFGIYILTYPGDFYLSTVLVLSIRRLHPAVPIMIIPGEGFDRDNHPFDAPIMPEPSGSFWPNVGHQDRKIWAFQGPFEIFLYLDADTICTKSLDQLMERISRERGDFMYVYPWMDDDQRRAVLENPDHPGHQSALRALPRDIGPGPLAEFDPEHDFQAHQPFNSGVFASRRLAIKESDFESLNRREREFYRNRLGFKEWSWHSSDLFFRDQGRLNYLAHKLSIPTFPLSPGV